MWLPITVSLIAILSIVSIEWKDLDAIITDDSIPKKIKDKYGLYTKRGNERLGQSPSSQLYLIVEQDVVVEWVLLR